MICSTVHRGISLCCLLAHLGMSRTILGIRCSPALFTNTDPDPRHSGRFAGAACDSASPGVGDSFGRRFGSRPRWRRCRWQGRLLLVTGVEASTPREIPPQTELQWPVPHGGPRRPRRRIFRLADSAFGKWIGAAQRVPGTRCDSNAASYIRASSRGARADPRNEIKFALSKIFRPAIWALAARWGGSPSASIRPRNRLAENRRFGAEMTSRYPLRRE